jgi:hypothetical protein
VTEVNSSSQYTTGRRHSREKDVAQVLTAGLILVLQANRGWPARNSTAFSYATGDLRNSVPAGASRLGMGFAWNRSRHGFAIQRAIRFDLF